MATTVTQNKTDAAARFTKQAEQLSLLPHGSKDDRAPGTWAVEAQFITPQDPVIVTANGGRLPAVPLIEAQKLNQLKREAERGGPHDRSNSSGSHVEIEPTGPDGSMPMPQNEALEGTNLKHQMSKQSTEPEAPLGSAIPPSRTNPLFPPLPLYGPPTLLRNVHCNIFRFTSFFLSLGFLAVIVLGSVFTSLPLMLQHIGLRLSLQDPHARRPFYREEMRRKTARREAAQKWKHQRRRKGSVVEADDDDNLEDACHSEAYIPTEGGDDPLICDVGYYARRVGLDIEEFKVQTEDGFIIQLWHVYNPNEYAPVPAEKRGHHTPEVFPADQTENGQRHGASGSQYRDGHRRYPVLLVHGLLQSSGAYCTNDDDSLAFFLCKR